MTHVSFSSNNFWVKCTQRLFLALFSGVIFGSTQEINRQCRHFKSVSVSCSVAYKVKLWVGKITLHNEIDFIQSVVYHINFLRKKEVLLPPDYQQILGSTALIAVWANFFLDLFLYLCFSLSPLSISIDYVSLITLIQKHEHVLNQVLI